MFSDVCTLDQLQEVCKSYAGLNPGGIVYVGTTRTECGGKPCPETMNDTLMAEVVYVDKDGVIVGDEANDYKPKPGECVAVKLS